MGKVRRQSLGSVSMSVVAAAVLAVVSTGAGAFAAYLGSRVTDVTGAQEPPIGGGMQGGPGGGDSQMSGPQGGGGGGGGGMGGMGGLMQGGPGGGQGGGGGQSGGGRQIGVGGGGGQGGSQGGRGGGGGTHGGGGTSGGQDFQTRFQGGTQGVSGGGNQGSPIGGAGQFTGQGDQEREGYQFQMGGHNKQSGDMWSTSESSQIDSRAGRRNFQMDENGMISDRSRGDSGRSAGRGHGEGSQGGDQGGVSASFDQGLANEVKDQIVNEETRSRFNKEVNRETSNRINEEVSRFFNRGTQGQGTVGDSQESGTFSRGQRSSVGGERSGRSGGEENADNRGRRDESPGYPFSQQVRDMDSRQGGVSDIAPGRSFGEEGTSEGQQARGIMRRDPSLIQMESIGLQQIGEDSDKKITKKTKAAKKSGKKKFGKKGKKGSLQHGAPASAGAPVGGQTQTAPSSEPAPVGAAPSTDTSQPSGADQAPAGQ